MQETAEHIIVNLLAQQRVFFATHQTKDIDFRLNQLRKLKKLVLQYEQKIADALWLDLHKSPEEAYLTETSIVLSEIDNHLKHLEQWAKPKAVATPIHLFPSSSKIIYEPLGVALIVAPWNYPFQLLFNPLIGAISAGCCSLLKPSPDAPNIAKVMQEMIAEAFDPKHICLVQGGRETNSILFAQRFNLIFFTGSPKVGKVVMRAAAEHLTPVILELGGKSPCVVDADADLDVAAKRIAWGKLLNAGQTCIAPDYLFAHSTIKDILLDKIAQHMKLMYGEDSKQSRFYPRIINQRAMDRLTELLSHGKIHTGGTFDRQEKYISPTIIDYVSPDFLLMQEEIFGPILPVMTFEHLDQAIDYINTNEKPLALYYFGKNKNAAEVLTKTSSGGACINDVILQVGNHHLPFGGVGNSGMGSYHGQESFLAFSHRRAVLTTPTWMDIPFKYVPFKYFKLLKKFI
ncbi:MAG TPA: aldehyde dehydrogenase family protein [Flavobacterium sp.]|nr:aldehyde dehydrogenase family protein [Flavobacterium sp.]